jgi:hypothetical protein
MTFTYYADAYRVNFQEGFDEANGESPTQNEVQSAIGKILPTNYYYFMREEFTRISDRLGHIFYVKDMTNPFLQVTEAPEKFNDQQKLDYLFKLLDESKKPLFVHIHWMGTHGPKYYPDTQVFSAGQKIADQGKYDDDFYEDSLLQFDAGIKKIYQALEERKLVNKTVLVVGSDHTQRWTIARIPMLIHFPNSDHAGLLYENTQNLDLAPTLLDYAGIPQPAWMPGQSLLTPLNPTRPIFLTAIPDSSKDPITNAVVYPDPVPPFYQFGKMTVIICNQYYQINFAKQTLVHSFVPGYIGKCQNDPISKKDALQLIVEHLEKYGFNASSLFKIEVEDNPK